METNPSTFKNSVPFAAAPIKFTEESPKRKTSFMVDDLVRDHNIMLNRACSDRRLCDSSLLTQKSSREGLTQSKPGIYSFCYFNDSVSKCRCLQ